MARPAPVARMTHAEYLAAGAASLGVQLEVASVYANPLGQ